jgi:hypothetical protein
MQAEDQHAAIQGSHETSGIGSALFFGGGGAKLRASRASNVNDLAARADGPGPPFDPGVAGCFKAHYAKFDRIAARQGDCAA